MKTVHHMEVKRGTGFTACGEHAFYFNGAAVGIDDWSKVTCRECVIKHSLEKLQDPRILMAEVLRMVNVWYAYDPADNGYGQEDCDYEAEVFEAARKFAGVDTRTR